MGLFSVQIIEFALIVILLSSVLYILYALVYLVYAFIKRVECKVNKVTVGLSVFGIISILILTGPNFVRTRVGGHFCICQNNCKNIGAALGMYSTDHGGKYPKSLGELTPRYINEIPKCPTQEQILTIAGFRIYSRKNPKDTYSPLYQAYNDLTGKHCRYTFCCAGENHRVIFLGNYPKYNSEHGLIIGK